MKKVIVLGGGMVGSVIAIDLAHELDFEVTLTDISEESLKRVGHYRKIKTVVNDLSNPETVKEIVKDYDMVCGAMPSALGLQTMEAVIQAGKNYCDISFMPENPSGLNSLAKEKGATVVYDCGVAPGMSHMFVGYADSQCDELLDVRIYVGGMPREKNPPWFFKAAFAPSDVLEEYTRPAMLVVDGEKIARDALSEREMMEFPGAGILEAFITDGLRSLVDTIKCPNMVEKTLRYMGHIDLIKTLRDTGFFSKTPIDLYGTKVTPLLVTEKLLFPFWHYEPEEEDMTVMRVIVRGMKSGAKIGYIWEMLDYYDRLTKTTSMARTTAFPCAITARMIMSGEFNKPGVNPPEYVGQQSGLLEKILRELDERDVAYLSRIE